MPELGKFSWFALRTTDLDAAEKFYEQVAGFRVATLRGLRTFYAAENKVGFLVDLPELARSRGAPAHWLGQVGVPDVESAMRDWVAVGAERLGPLRRFEDGAVAILRDPQGAVFALSSTKEESAGGIVWCDLNTTDRGKAWETYSKMFGWKSAREFEAGPPGGTYQVFSWADGEAEVGTISNSALAPHIHTHWSFSIAVSDLDDSCARVRELGGMVVAGPLVFGKDRVAVCDDAQGAAFSLRERS